MFLKRLRQRKNGKGHAYWALVESIRTAKGSRRRVLADVGELKKSEKGAWTPPGGITRFERPGSRCCASMSRSPPFKALRRNLWCGLMVNAGGTSSAGCRVEHRRVA